MSKKILVKSKNSKNVLNLSKWMINASKRNLKGKLNEDTMAKKQKSEHEPTPQYKTQPLPGW